ncbi:MAG TPA: hypothetical protein VJ964_10320 [Balneolaceae bacterium]|nr:hypothetical protein [Balneolaceae bacterium]
MKNWQRAFAYTSGALVLGLLLIVVSHNFIQYVARPTTAGYLFLVGFGLVFLNLNFGFSRRFSIKAPNQKWVCFLMALFTIGPTLFWVYTKDVKLGDARLEFVLTVIFSAVLGSIFGIRRGLAKRKIYLKELQELEEHEMPNSLKRPHDDLNKN